MVQYNDANREVAVLCNHQRSLPKNWEENTAKKREKLEMMQGQVEALKKMLATVRRGEEIKLMPEKYRSAVAKLEIPEGASEETVKELKLKRQAEVNERAKFAHMFKTQPSRGAGGEAARDVRGAVQLFRDQAEGLGERWEVD